MGAVSMQAVFDEHDGEEIVGAEWTTGMYDYRGFLGMYEQEAQRLGRDFLHELLHTQPRFCPFCGTPLPKIVPRDVKSLPAKLSPYACPWAGDVRGLPATLAWKPETELEPEGLIDLGAEVD